MRSRNFSFVHLPQHLTSAIATLNVVAARQQRAEEVDVFMSPVRRLRQRVIDLSGATTRPERGEGAGYLHR